MLKLECPNFDRRCEAPKEEAMTQFSSPRISGTRSGVTDSMKSSLIMTGVAKPHAPRHSTSITVYLPSLDVWPSSSQPVALRNASTTPSAPQTLHGDVVHT